MFVAIACGASPAVYGAPMAVETLFQKYKYGGATLSPSGRYLGVITTVNGRRNIGILDLDTRKINLATSFDEADVIRLVWQTDDRMIAIIGDAQQGTGDPPRISGMVAFNRDGNDVHPFHNSFLRPLAISLQRAIPGGNDVVMSAWERSVHSVDLYRFNTVTGGKTLLTLDSPGNATRWLLDFDNVPRAVVTNDLDTDKTAWFVRKSANDPWRKVEEAPLARLHSVPLTFSPDGSVIYVSSRRKGDFNELYEYQVESGEWKGPIASQEGRDLVPFFRTDLSRRKLFGFQYVGDKPSAVWFDPEWERMQKSVDAALPDTVNTLQHSGNRWIIVSTSDRDPGEASLLDGKTMKLEKLFSYAPWVKPDESVPLRWVRYKARDGLTIPALLGVPKGNSKRIPLVVDIHGGPNAPATEWRYYRETQFFASRGYAVLYPQFRGTEGFGWKLLSAGYRKWGDEMQDDLEDGVKWAIAEGIADPERVCFYGASYGGYAAMWGAIKNADLIKCSVAYVGVSSIDYLFDNAQTDLSQLADRSTLMIERIGDPKTERARFKRVNPLDNADKVGVPILLAYGALDRRVPMVHGTDFRAALDRYHKPYEWLLYDHEGHGFNREENVFDFYNHVDAFLAKYLGPTASVKKTQ
jgi:dipeptidyl aminopeptidase/acylaminoacyl peptidase